MKSSEQVRIFPLGDAALTVEFGKAVSIDLNNSAIVLSRYFEQNPFRGFIESVPAYASTTIFYDPRIIRHEFPEFSSAFNAIKHLALSALDKVVTWSPEPSRVIEIPVYFDAGSALDLDHIVKLSGLCRNEVIQIFTERIYHVFMLGFLPGFTYMGEVDDRIATPRKATPRMRIPKGSVGIGGKQTGIYSLESPGGWQIIGRTEAELFRPHAQSPSYLQPGDQVQFISNR